MLLLDEFAFVHNNVADEFFASVYPTISSGKESKIAIISTPNGMNHFYKLITEAQAGLNGFNLTKAIW
jgi:phage FluMu gp28-like protein